MTSHKQPPYRAAHIANFILDKAEEDGIHDISILKLLKLVYIFFGWVSAIHSGTKLFYDPIEAWKYGPVVPSLYYELRRFGMGKVTGRATLYDPYDDQEVKTPTKEDITDKDILETLEIIWGSYKDAPAEHLIALTHQQGTPWWDTFDGTPNKVIPTKLIHKYYTNLYNAVG